LDSYGLSPVEHLEKCQAMEADGYRLVSISAASIRGELIMASVWHRPLVADDAKEALARRNANAAVAALRMNQTDRVWPLLRHSDDPRLRTWIIHRLSPMGASADNIVKRLDEEPGVVKSSDVEINEIELYSRIAAFQHVKKQKHIQASTRAIRGL
jgi:hypothetical protein